MAFLPVIALSQELPEVIPPSPTVANLMHFEEVPVSHYTGQPDITIPIFNKKINSDLNFPIALRYDTKGIQVYGVSGWTGTGWSLSAGGVISRTVRDVPDETVKGTLANKTGILHTSDYWNYDNLTNAQKDEYRYKVVGGKYDKFDNQLDLYQFNFLNYSGRFVIVKNGVLLEAKLIDNRNKLKINLNYTTDFALTSFEIVDLKGYRYVFDVSETTTTSSSYESIRQGEVFPNGSVETSTVKTAWHLSKVYTSNNIEVLELNYQTSTEGYTGEPIYTYNKIRTLTNTNDLLSNSYNIGILRPKESISQQSHTTTTKKLLSAHFKDSTSIEFTVKLNSPHPEMSNNSTILENIIIKDNGVEDKRYTLAYEETNRLWLKKVTETSNGQSLDTEINYNNKSALPYFTNQGDSWGYYSGLGEDTSNFCAASSFDEQLITTGLIESIVYPTGGVKEFEFEHNSFSYYGDEPVPYEHYMQNPKNTSSAPSIFIDNHSYVHLSSSSPDVITTFTIPFQQDVYLTSWIDYANSDTQYINEHVLAISNANFYSQIDLEQNCIKIPNVPAGTYDLVLAIRDTELLNSYTIQGDYRINYTQQASTVRHEVLGGGVRIKNIVFRDGPLAQISKQVDYEYLDNNDINSLRASGVIDANANMLEKSHSLTTTKYLFEDADFWFDEFNPTNVTYDVTVKGKNVLTSQGSHVAYKNVRVSENSNGYTTYDFTSAFEYPSPDVSLILYPVTAPQPNIDFKRGLLKSQKTYEESGKILKEVNNTQYEFVEEFVYKKRTPFKSESCPWFQFYDNYTFYSGKLIDTNLVPTCSDFSQPCFSQSQMDNCGLIPELTTDFYTGIAQLKDTTTKEYFYDAQNNQSIKETRQTFTYNTDNYLIAEQDTYYKVKGVDEHLETKYYYPVGPSLNSNSSTIKNKLIINNKINEILETVSFRNGTQISETHNIYDDFDTSLTDDLMLPKEVKVGKGSLTPEKRIEFLKYDSYGNPTEVKKTDGSTIVYLYGFNGSVPVAKISNASFSSVSSALSGVTTFSGNMSTAQENSLRNASSLNDAMISFYRYDPLKGVISTSDDKGYTTSYEYDAFNRLKRVKDAQGKILGENTYHYKNQ
ncbi:hypothetical protein GCM10011444_28050 [Winogradskyella haliclonae]|uniref:YD repeat-containing protein n=2 Tax=Winogradskyella haliclonae TaxID=2048558 RepID=A0ABQ2C1P9_9FLAO|nr:hypothetical protein GCM10011444_28050 [Winogradskyella haliclonae]